MKLFGVFGGLAFVCSMFGVWAASQSIRWLAPEQDVLPPGTAYPLRAEASSGLPVHFRVVSGPAVLSGDELTVTGVDHVLVAAEQPGDSTFGPANALRSFNRYQIQLEPEPETRFDAEAQEAVVLDDVMLIAAGTGDFRIYDNPTEGVPRLLGRFDARGAAQSVCAVGNHAFVSFSGGFVQVINIWDRTLPRPVGPPIPVSGVNLSLALRNGYLYFTEDYEGVGIVNVSQPDRPARVGRYQPPGNRTPIHQVAVQGNRLFVAVPTGLLVVDVFTPAAPVTMGRYVASDIQRMVAISESRVLIFRNAVAQLLDVSDPSSIQELWSHTSSIGRVANAVVDGSLIHMTSPYGGMEILDLFPSGLPRPVGRMGNLSDVWLSSAGPIWMGKGRRLYSGHPSGGIHAVQERRWISQNLEWSQPEAGRLERNVSYPLRAHASSRLPVEFSVVSGPAVVEAGAIRLTNAGPAVVVARQAGTADVLPVEERRTFNRTLVQPSRVGTFGLADRPRDLRIWDGMAFVALGEKGVQVLDVRNPEAPVQLSHITNGYPEFSARSLARSGNLLFVGGLGYQVFDVSNPETPRFLGTRSDPNPFEIIAVSGNALVAAGPLGVQVLDISNLWVPPYLVWLAPSGSYSHSVDCRGTLVAVVDSARGVSLWDVATPSSPVRRGNIRVESVGSVVAVRFRGDSLLISTHAGLEIHDVSDPVRPRRVGQFTGSLWPFTRPSTSDSFAVASSQWLDIRDPSVPHRVAELSGTVFAEFFGNHVVTASGQPQLQLFTWREGMTQTVDWVGPDDTILQSGTAYPLAAKAAGGGPVQFEVLSGPAEIRDGALVVTHVLPPQSVIVRAVQPGGAFDFPGETVRVFNRVEAEFEELGTLSTSGQVQAVALTNGFAFIAESTEGVVTVDVRDPAQPRRMSAVRLGTAANDLVVSDGRAVVVEQSGHLTVVDGRDPANPRVVGTLNLGAPLSQVVVRGTTAFLSSPEGIRIVDLTQPSNPRLVGGLKRSDLGAAPLFLIERAGFLYMSHRGAGFSIVDVQDRERPALMGTLAERVSTGGFAFVGDWLWARRDPLGLCALDVSVPSAPRIRSLQPIPEVSWSFGYGSMPVAENLIISDASKGLIAVEILGPDQTLVAGSYVSRRNWDLVRGMSLDGELLGVANSRGGLRLLRLRRGIRTSLTGLPLPTAAEKGQAIALSPTFNGHIPLEYTVVSGPARIVGGQLHLDDVGQVEIGAAVAPSGRFLPVQIRHVLRVDSFLLDAIRGAADDELILDWRVDTDVLETAEQVGGPWSPVPGARPPFRIPELGTRGYYRVIRNP